MPTVIEKPVELTGYQHDGTEESALAIQSWLLGNSALSAEIGDENRVYFVEPNTIGRQIVFTNWWVLRLSDGRTVSMSEREFKSRFVPYSHNN